MEKRALKYTIICHHLLNLIGFVSIITGVMLLAEWKPHFDTLTLISSSCGFILSGFILLLSNHHKKTHYINIIVNIFSMIIILIGIMTILEFMIGYPVATWHTGCMSFITALNFIFVAFGFILNTHQTKRLSLISGSLVFFLSLFSFYNYIFNADVYHHFTAYISMSIPSTVLFILLSTSIFLLKPYTGMTEIALKDSSSGYYLRRMLPFILLVPIAISIVENLMILAGYIEQNLGDSVVATGTFIILSIAISIIIRRMDIEEKRVKTTEIQLQHSDIIFREFADNIDIVFYRTSPDLSQLYYVSPAYEKIWGRSVESEYKNPSQWFESILPEDQEFVRENYYNKLVRGDASVYTEFRIKKPDGDIRNILARGFNLRDKNSERFCIIGIAIDITALKQEKIYLQNREDILYITQHETVINGAAPKILKMICEMLHWDLGELWLIDKTKSTIRFVNNWHIESKKINTYNKMCRAHTFKMSEGLPGRIWQERGAVWIPDYSKRTEFSCSFDAQKAGLNCAFGIPITFQDEIFGIMEFFSYKIQPPDEAMLIQMETIGKLMGEFTHRIYSNDEIEALSRRDILTGLLNRSALEEDLNNLIQDKKFEIMAIIIVDIDRFKLINEAIGYDKSNLIIKSAATRLAKLIDQDKSHAARLGADKFILYYFDIQNTEDILDYAYKIDNTFKEPFIINEKEAYLTASIGISIYPQDGMNSQILISNAEQALNIAKKDGGNNTKLFTKELSGIALDKLAMHIDLHQAMAKNQFFLHYQPQINLKTGNICGAEALVRWQHPTKGIIAPGSFIPYAEETGLIIPLNEHIMRMVFQQVRSGWTGPPISVNVSAQQFKEKNHLTDFIQSLLGEFSVDPKYIELEITESLLMEDTQHTIEILGTLQQMGFQFSIDDFGTGFSSFNYLYRVPAHKVKIDMSFIRGLPQNSANAEIVKSMIVMLHALGKIVVAEGAETVTEIEFLRNENCDIVQGYFYYKPMPIQNFLALIAQKTLSLHD